MFAGISTILASYDKPNVIVIAEDPGYRDVVEAMDWTLGHFFEIFEGRLGRRQHIRRLHHAARLQSVWTGRVETACARS